MTGNEFLRRLRKLARKRSVRLQIVTEQGKGSHVTLYFGAGMTVLKDRKKEIGAGLLHAMCRQLGIDRNDLY